jgi:putative endonuclease
VRPSFRGARSASPGIHNPCARDGILRLHSCEQKHGTLYLGVTKDLIRSTHEHKDKAFEGFSKRYAVDKLVWFELYDDALTAIAPEKELKKWRRDWKIRLIEESNPSWDDLYPGIASQRPVRRVTPSFRDARFLRAGPEFILPARLALGPFA